ncbi:phage portal protein [Delftia tsuruhatensis]|uniref:phage portal protein n=1 Tax=Delftia tsuruhatensis TaxID=180282 RepID=UPI001055FE26|nr:phage portal protein [Delftia tsuruhatensis]TDF32965.1 phage portal protein [Delftia tsuruhatensis]
MAPRFTANGKRIGRPPKNPQTAQAAQPVSAEDAAMGRAFRQFLNRYDAAGRGRRMASWNAPSTGPNQAINAALQVLRDRSSDSARNDWSSESIIQKWTTTLVGIAITPRFHRIKAKERRQEINDLWTDFVREADADGVLDAYGMQTLAVRSWIERGEMFGRRRYRKASDGLAVPMQVQLLEADMVPNFDADTYTGLPVNNKIRSGIEFDNRGKKIAYWVYKEHPGDGVWSGAGGTPDATALVRVPAEDMFHMFEPKRIGARRGVPTLAPILAKQRNILDYEDATLERQKIANLFVAFISRSLPSLDPTDPNHQALTGLESEIDGEAAPLLPMKPGLMQELEDGQTVEFAKPPDAGTSYSDYMRTSHLGTTAGTGVPYELAVGDIANVSDRTLRVVINEYRRFAAQRQWQIVIFQKCQRVVEWFADAALLAGKVSLEERDAIRRAEHAPHGWEYIHPVQDVEGKALEVKNGFRSRSSVIGEQGDDPDVVDQERADDAERERALGLPVSGVADAAASNPAPDPAARNPAANADDAAVQAELERIKRVEAQTDALREAARASQARERAQARQDELHQSVLALLRDPERV